MSKTNTNASYAGADKTKLDGIAVGATANVGTVTSVTAGNGMTQSGTNTVNPTLDIVSHTGTAGSIGTINIGTDAIGVDLGSTSTTACSGADSRLSDARTPLSHAHGNITNDGAIGTTASLPVITATSGVLTTGTFGTTAGTFAAGDHTHSIYAPTVFKASYQLTDGTAGGNTIAGGTTYPLNTVLNNTISGASMTSSIITLPAGKYLVNANVFLDVAAVAGGFSALTINDGTNNIAQSVRVDSGTTYGIWANSILEDYFELASTTNISLKYWCLAKTNGLGTVSTQTGFPEKFGQIMLTKVG